MSMQFSGAQWVTEFPGSESLDDLVDPFRGNMKKFCAALDKAMIARVVTATRRPAERAYLMHWSWLIAKGLPAAEVPPHDGVDIDWTHGGDVKAARVAAQAMVRLYGIAFQPSLTSNHIAGTACDMMVLARPGQTLVDNYGDLHTFTVDANGYNPLMIEIAESYYVKKLLTDLPHWSLDGH